MQTVSTEHEPLRITTEVVLTIITALTGGSPVRDEGESPSEADSWEALTRRALERTFALEPGLSPWGMLKGGVLAENPQVFDGIGGGRHLGEDVALNPQPLPPRYAFVTSAARIMAERAELLQELADGMASGAEERGIIIVGGRLRKFCDEWCGNGFRLKWPFPGPPPNWFSSELQGIDLLVIGAQLRQSSRESFSSELRRNLADASMRFAEAGLSKMLQKAG